MSDKRWGVEEWHEFPEWGEILTWPSDPPLRVCLAEVDDEDDPEAIAAYAALVECVRKAEAFDQVLEIVGEHFGNDADAVKGYDHIAAFCMALTDRP